MRFTIILVVALALQLSAQQTAVIRPPQAQPPPQTSRGTAAVTGTVVDAQTGAPVASAIVTLEDRQPGRPRGGFVQVTTPTGRFAFVDLPASDMYFLNASKPGYLDGGYGRTDSRGPGAPISTTANQWVRDLRVAIARPGSISGVVTDERGESIVGAYVRVLPQVPVAGRPQLLAGIVAQTDDRGAYRIAGLGPGKYVVSVPSVQATLPASANLPPPGAGAGTSMPDLRAAREAARAEKLLIETGAGLELIVGRYMTPPPPAPDGTRTAYPIVFYPNVSAPADAAPIELRTSEERSGIDFQLRPVRAARVSGVVQGPPDAVGNLLLRLIPTGLEELGQGSEAAVTVTLADGRFTFLDVPSGSFVLTARHTLTELAYASVDEARTALPAPIPFPARSAASRGVRAAAPGVQMASLQDSSDQTYWGQVRVDVGARDVDDVLLPLRPTVTLSGHIVWAPGATPSRNSLVMALEPSDGRRSLGMFTALRDQRADPSPFTFAGLMAGEYLLRVGIGSATVESIVWDGQDYTDRPFDAGAGRDIGGVVVTLNSAMSTIAGVVRDGNASLSASAAVIAFPVERERWTNYGFNPTRLQSVFTTAGGGYRIDGLPPGEYYLIAVPAAQERAWLDPAFLAAHAGQASRVRVHRSDTRLADVTLTLLR